MKANQVSGSRCQRLEVRDQGVEVRLVSTRVRLVILCVLLSLSVLACGAMNPRYQTNNQVRLAVYEYERKVRGPADDLVIDFQRDEPRIKFEGQNDNGGRTVWLYRAGAKEFFALRSPDSTYLYIQNIEYADNYRAATVKIYRGDAHSFKGRQLTLKLGDDGHWAVTTDVEIEPPASE
jgi:hypothetical protein